MLMQAFNDWRNNPNNNSFLQSENSYDIFSIFFQEKSAMKNFVEMMSDLAWEVYELQVCMEGIIEDLNDEN